MNDSLSPAGHARQKPIGIGLFLLTILLLGSTIGAVVSYLGSRAWILLPLPVIVGLFIVLVRWPRWGIWLIPISVVLPQTLPRVSSRFGYMELTLAFLSLALLMHFIVFRKPVRLDWFLGVMLLAAVPLALSAVLGRGQEDGIRFYNWLGTCLVYFLVLNLVRGKRGSYWILLGFAVIVTGMILADFLFFSGVPLPKTDYEWYLYRSMASTIAGRVDPENLSGQANFVVSLATMFFPIPLAYGLLTGKTALRLLCLILVVGNIVLAALVSTRAFFLFAVVASCAMLLPALLKHRGSKFVVVGVILLAAGFSFIRLSMPEAWGQLVERFVDTYQYGDPRFEIWKNQLQHALRAPVLGYGAIGEEQILLRFGFESRGRHGLFPQIFFEYGIVFVVPIAVLLIGWVQRSWSLLRSPHLTAQHFAVALASWGIVSGLLANAVINVHLVLTVQYSVLAFCLAALLAVERWHVRSASTDDSHWDVQ